jgi:drug/metabolite transporter (DMT)-like permease
MRKPLAPTRGRELIWLGLLQTAGFVGMVSLALDEGAAGKSAVLAYTMPFWTLVMASIMLNERVQGAQWVAVALAGAGLIGVLSPWDAELAMRDSLWSLGAAFSWAAGNIVVKRMDLDGDELLNVSAWQMAIGTIGLGALALAIDTESVRWTTSFSLALAYNVVFATALAWLLWLFALSRLSAIAAGLAALGTPVFSLFAAWLQLGELPTRAEAWGMGLILAALAVLSLAGWLGRATRTPTGA